MNKIKHYVQCTQRFFFAVDNGMPLMRPCTNLGLQCQESHLKLRKTNVVQFLCSITMLVVKEFHLTCSCVLSILDKFLKQLNKLRSDCFCRKYFFSRSTGRMNGSWIDSKSITIWLSRISQLFAAGNCIINPERTDFRGK